MALITYYCEVKILTLWNFNMTNLIIQTVEKEQTKQNLPEIKAGYTVRVHQKIKEGEKERVQIYEGLVIAISHGHGPNKTITVRKVVEGIGVEKIFPLSSPNIVKIEVVRIGKVRRAKLYYMRNVSGKAARLKEVLVSGKVADNEANKEAVQAEEVLADTDQTENNSPTSEAQDTPPTSDAGSQAEQQSIPTEEQDATEENVPEQTVVESDTTHDEAAQDSKEGAEK